MRKWDVSLWVLEAKPGYQGSGCGQRRRYFRVSAPEAGGGWDVFLPVTHEWRTAPKSTCAPCCSGQWWQEQGWDCDAGSATPFALLFPSLCLGSSTNTNSLARHLWRKLPVVNYIGALLQNQSVHVGSKTNLSGNYWNFSKNLDPLVLKTAATIQSKYSQA